MKKDEITKKLLQMFVAGYRGEIPDDNFCECIKNGLGGVIFFAENMRKRQDFQKNIKYMKTLSDIPLFLSIDQEGGLIERTIFLDEKIEYLTPKTLSFIGDEAAIKLHYSVLARDLCDLGINLDFAPVLDVNNNPDNPIINVRSFGNTPETVNKYSKIVIDIFKENSIISCGKHYPGHGDTNIDSHKNMPQIDMEFEKFKNIHLNCFEEAIKNNVDTIMVSHIHFPFWDRNILPASLSRNAINYLKNELKFNGIIFSDDMIMGGISKYYGLKESIIKGLKAGIDCFIFRYLSDELLNVIDDISSLAENDSILQTLILERYEKIVRFKKEKIKTNIVKKINVNAEQQIIDKIAQKIKKKYTQIKTLPKDKNIKIISFNYKEVFNLSYPHSSLKNFLTGYTVSEILYSLDLEEKDCKTIISKIDDNDFVIFLSYNPQINKNQVKLFNMINSEKILVHLGMDNERMNNDKYDTISLCSAKTPIIKTLAELLIGK